MRVSDLNTMNESDELLAKMSDEVKKKYKTLLSTEAVYLDNYKRARGELQKHQALLYASGIRHSIMDLLYKHNLLTD